MVVLRVRSEGEVRAATYTKDRCLQLASRAKGGGALSPAQSLAVKEHRLVHAAAERVRAAERKNKDVLAAKRARDESSSPPPSACGSV